MPVVFLTQKQFAKKFKNVPKARARASKPRPTFRNPVQFQIRFPEWTVCQGFSKVSETGFFAWIEKDGFCVDLTHVSKNEYFSIIVGSAPLSVVEAFLLTHRKPRAEFYAEHAISAVKRYSKEQVRAMLDSERTYGPWKESA